VPVELEHAVHIELDVGLLLPVEILSRPPGGPGLHPARAGDVVVARRQGEGLFVIDVVARARSGAVGAADGPVAAVGAGAIVLEPGGLRGVAVGVRNARVAYPRPGAGRRDVQTAV